MWLFCTECGHLFEDGEQDFSSETLDYIDREPYQETRSGCPVCGGSYIEACVCRKCGGAFDPDIMVGDYCPECLDELMTTDTMKQYIRLDLENFAEWLSEGDDD